MRLIDLHTHRANDALSVQILNVFAQDLPNEEIAFPFSAGLHPWDIDVVNLEECIQSIGRAASQKNMLAVGECGLDRAIATDFALQEQCFQKQIQLAMKYHKPLIIHCVRAYSDLIRFKKKNNSDIPWIIHGFAANRDTTLGLLKHGFYFSVGERLLKDIRKHDILRSIPLDRLFLETDNDDISIVEIYSLAAQLLHIDQDALVETLERNFEEIFGKVIF